jgi:hypothetical protein
MKIENTTSMAVLLKQARDPDQDSQRGATEANN